MTRARIGRWLFGLAGAASALFVHLLPAPAEFVPAGAASVPGVSGAVTPAPLPAVSGTSMLPFESSAAQAAALPATARRPRPEPPDATPVAIVPADAALVVEPSPGPPPIGDTSQVLPGATARRAATPARTTTPAPAR